jgi:hypothetical protein
MGTTQETVIRRLFPKQELIWENESHTLEFRASQDWNSLPDDVKKHTPIFTINLN